MFQHLILALTPGLDLGIKALWNTGEVMKIQDNCQEPLKQLGTGKNWKIISIDGEQYTKSLLDQKMAGNVSYELSFTKTVILHFLFCK